MIMLTPEREDELLEQVRKDLVAKLIEEHRNSLDLISPAQLAGMMDITPKTLASITYSEKNPDGIPRHEIVPGTVIRYRLSEVEAWLEDNRQGP